MLNEQQVKSICERFQVPSLFMRRCKDAYAYPEFQELLHLIDGCAYPGGRNSEKKAEMLLANCHAIAAILDTFSRGRAIFSLIDELCSPLVDEVLADEDDASKHCERCHCVEGTNTDCPECCANLPEPIPNGEHVGIPGYDASTKTIRFVDNEGMHHHVQLPTTNYNAH